MMLEVLNRLVVLHTGRTECVCCDAHRYRRCFDSSGDSVHAFQLPNMPRRRLHADAWQAALESRIQTTSSAQRMQLKRLRDAGETTSAMLRTAGRRRSHGVLPRSEARRRRRDQQTAAVNGAALIKELLRLRIILKRRLTDSSDCRRMMRLAAAVRCRGASLNASFLLLLVDRALRRPRLSAKLMRSFEKHQAAASNSMEAAWKAVVDIRRHPESRQLNAVFWKGPASLSCRGFISCLSAPAVVDVIGRLQLGTQPLDVTHAAKTLSELPHVSKYSAFAILRILPACLNVQLRDTEGAARSMSDTVSNMERIVSLQCARRLSAAASRCAVREVHDGDGALLLCEASKALVVLGVLPAASSEWSAHLLQTALASKATTALIKTLRHQQPMTDDHLRELKSARAQESRLVDVALPRTRAGFDRAPHYCAGSEMVAGLLIKRLQGVGWLDENFGADVFLDAG